jgi:hypothetical protein
MNPSVFLNGLIMQCISPLCSRLMDADGDTRAKKTGNKKLLPVRI